MQKLIHVYMSFKTHIFNKISGAGVKMKAILYKRQYGIISYDYIN